MKRAMIIAGWTVLAAGPVRADLVGALDPVTPANNLQQLNPGGSGTVGVLTAGGGLYPNTAVTTLGYPIVGTKFSSPNASDILVVTFAIHWPYATPVQVTGMRHGLIWDTNEVALLGAGPAGPFVANNIGTTPAAGAAAINGIVAPLSGTEGVVGIEEVPAEKFIIFGSDVVPFARFTFHVLGALADDGIPDIIMPTPGTTGGGADTFGVGILFDFVIFTTSHSSFSIITNTIKTSTGFINFGSSRDSFGAQLKPEPASATLLTIGVLAIAGGARQRRRRCRD